MREILFRVWHPVKKEMSYSCGLVDDKYHCALVAFDGDEFGDYPKAATLVWMQYTGIRDKHGLLVYEGDLVSLNRPNSYLKGTYTVNWSEHWAGFVFTDTKGAIATTKQGRPYALGQPSMIVVGNIFTKES